MYKIIFCLNIFALLTHHALCTPYAITGAQTFGLGIQPRLEIRDMMEERPMMYNLYLLALRAFQAENQDQKLSFFQIAGLHGYPSIPWDNVKRESKGVGYCIHQEVIFGSWHRPYVALFEQRLQYYALKIAKQFKDEKKRSQYLEEGKRLRSAYWDWARPLKKHEKNQFPKIFSNKQAFVEMPSGKQQNIANPFYQYHFHPLKPDYFESYYQEMRNTLRYPDNVNASMANSNNEMLESYMETFAPGWQSNIYQWFAHCDKFFEMNDAGRPKNSGPRNPKCHVTLETTHGDVHAKIGGFTNRFAGHMTDLKMSGFDPLFFMHHTNIDRLMAMWQVLYPDEYVYKTTFNANTFVYKKGAPVDQDTVLKPFHKNTKGDFWTSRQVRNHRIFNTTYPEFLQGGDDADTMRKLINQIYGPKAGTSSKSTAQPLVAANSSSFEYLVDIVSTKNKLGGSYSTYLFLGEPANESDPATWITDANIVGSLSTFSTNDMKDDNSVVTSSISLTDSLAKQVASGALPDLTEETVVPYLTKALRWKVVAPEGNLVNPSTVPDFRISAFASTLAPLTDFTKFPEWSAFVPLPAVTRGKPGGA